jgi:hypothetical protein
MIGQSEDDWDDATIMKVFHDSIKRHKTGRNTVSWFSGLLRRQSRGSRRFYSDC